MSGRETAEHAQSQVGVTVVRSNVVRPVFPDGGQRGFFSTIPAWQPVRVADIPQLIRDLYLSARCEEGTSWSRIIRSSLCNILAVIRVLFYPLITVHRQPVRLPTIRCTVRDCDTSKPKRPSSLM